MRIALAEGGALRGDDVREIPEHPTFFTNHPINLVGSGAPLAVDPALSPCVDYEAELCVVDTTPTSTADQSWKDTR